MTDPNERLELRASHRTTRSDPIIFRADEREHPEVGWLLESSTEGFAFAHRSAKVPQPGRLILVELDVTRSDHPNLLAEVRRVRRVHDDLHIVACRLRPDCTCAERTVFTTTEMELKLGAPSANPGWSP
ncbi:MAG: hypothetical protein AAGB51_01250 [Planctomycetota bacterium]